MREESARRTRLRAAGEFLRDSVRGNAPVIVAFLLVPLVALSAVVIPAWAVHRMETPYDLDSVPAQVLPASHATDDATGDDGGQALPAGDRPADPSGPSRPAKADAKPGGRAGGGSGGTGPRSPFEPPIGPSPAGPAPPGGMPSPSPGPASPPPPDPPPPPTPPPPPDPPPPPPAEDTGNPSDDHPGKQTGWEKHGKHKKKTTK